ncbi:MAG: methyl-accepting chemotaxis protein [Rhizobiaceae bacterium]|nr:MAG: methyl-accepting chemotaxis protein [Rhizobiaceae bacterium]CAG0953001.1 Methyl-accepting chemotaxis protein II [Rhizobiaceae bacterium]
MKRLDEIRRMASVFVVALMWVDVVLILAKAWFAAEASAAVLAIGSLLVAGTATALWAVDRVGQTTRFVSGASHAALVALLVYAFTGSTLQIDMHMYFFASLAVLAMWVDWRPIFAFTAVTAVHHLVLYVVMPAAVFPGESEFTRVILHAVILLMEAGMLFMITRIVARALNESETALADSLVARQQASELSHEAEEARAAKEREQHERAAAKAEETRQMQAAVAELATGLKRLADGDLTVSLSQPFVGELDRLRVDFNLSVEKLSEILKQIQGSAISMDESAAEIRSASNDLLKRTEQQAASLEETSNAFEDVATSVRLASTKADEASRIAATASASTTRSRGVVTNAVEAMNRTQEASNEISQITDLIDGITFQTNLLALNAGVEAARAGEAGKGFAVVAQEVRALAQRASGAATDIRKLIEKSGTEVDQGVNLVNAAGESLEEISVQVALINDTIGAIAAASRTQAESLGEIKASVNQIDKITQMNAAMVEENTAVTHRLAGEASGLSELVRQFRLGGSRPVGAGDKDRPAPSPAREMMASLSKAFSRG